MEGIQKEVIMTVFFKYKIDMFHISCFIASFFPDSFAVRTKVPLLFCTLDIMKLQYTNIN